MIRIRYAFGSLAAFLAAHTALAGPTEALNTNPNTGTGNFNSSPADTVSSGVTGAVPATGDTLSPAGPSTTALATATPSVLVSTNGATTLPNVSTNRSVASGPIRVGTDIYTNAIQNLSKTMDAQALARRGVHAGGFMLYPTIGVEETFDGNVFRTPNNKQVDLISEVQPGMSLASNWRNHSVTFSADGDFGAYADNSSENFQDYALEANGRLDVKRGTFFTGDVNHSHLHEYRGSPNNFNGTEPPEFDQTLFAAGFRHQPGRLKFSADAQNTNYNYDESIDPFVNIQLNNRNRDEQRYATGVAWELIPGYDAFARYAYIERQFEDDATLSRDSHAHETQVGTALDLTGTLRGEVFVGSFNQNYETIDRSLNFVNYGGTLTWNLTPLTSLQGDVSRNVRPTVFGNAADYVETSYRAVIAHSLTPDWLLNGEARYVKDNFITLGTGPDRDDEIYITGVGARYLMGEGLALDGNYRYIDRDSTASQQSFTNNVVSLKLSYAF